MELGLPNILLVFLITILGTFVPFIVVVILWLGSSKLTVKAKKIISLAMLVTFIGAIVASTLLSNKNNADLNAEFSSKLAEQYDATSKRPFSDMIDVIYDKGEVSTTFIRDGVETDVFIKRVHNDSRQKMKLIFTVYNEGALYPQAAK